MKWLSLIVTGFALTVAGAQAESNAVTAGEFRVEPPTLLNLGFQWDMTGDVNRNATVEVRFSNKFKSTTVSVEGSITSRHP